MDLNDPRLLFVITCWFGGSKKIKKYLYGRVILNSKHSIIKYILNVIKAKDTPEEDRFFAIKMLTSAHMLDRMTYRLDKDALIRHLKSIYKDINDYLKTDFNFKVEKPFDGDDFDELKAHQPFFAEIQLFEPHRGSWGPAKTLEYHVDPAKVELPPYYPDDPTVRKDWAGYLDTVDYLDTKVAIILKRLADQGLSDNTVIFFFGDNGRCHVRDKQWLYEGGLHIPLIIRWPGKLKPGSVRDDLVSAIDISATSLKIAGVTLPTNMQGRAFLEPGGRIEAQQVHRIDQPPVHRLQPVAQIRQRASRDRR